MKKLFMKETDEEVFEGDMIEIECEKEFSNTKLKRNVEFEVTEDSIPYLIEMDIIEEREIEDEEELEDFDSPCEELVALMEDFDILKDRVDKLEELYKSLTVAKKSAKKK